MFLQWWAFENVIVPRDQTLNEDKKLKYTHQPTIAETFCWVLGVSFNAIT